MHEVTRYIVFLLNTEERNPAADNDEDARAMLHSLKQTVSLDGQLISTIPAWVPRYIRYMKLQTVFQSS